MLGPTVSRRSSSPSSFAPSRSTTGFDPGNSSSTSSTEHGSLPSRDLGELPAPAPSRPLVVQTDSDAHGPGRRGAVTAACAPGAPHVAVASISSPLPGVDVTEGTKIEASVVFYDAHVSWKPARWTSGSPAGRGR